MKFLLHSCCAPCAAYVIKELKERGFEVAAFFYNPNIFPMSEYEKRRDELKKYCEENKIEFIEGEYNHKAWLENLVKSLGLGHLSKERSFAALRIKFKEGGRRCEACYKLRLEETVKLAKKDGYDFWGSTLSISPHKKAEKINDIGQNLQKRYAVKFFKADWKKKNGFKLACELSKRQDFYRQNYCGCEFS